MKNNVEMMIAALLLGATATGATAVNLISGAMTRTTALIKLDDAGTSSGATFAIRRARKAWTAPCSRTTLSL